MSYVLLFSLVLCAPQTCMPELHYGGTYSDTVQARAVIRDGVRRMESFQTGLELCQQAAKAIDAQTYQCLAAGR